jgi:DNA-binding transcriptional LysR family regulator
MMKGVTLQQLKAFITVAKHLAFGKAAEELCLTPPAVSMQIKELELAIDMLLFDRDGNRVSLTTPGEYLLVYARRILSTLKDAEQAMACMRRVEYGYLTVGLVSTTQHFLPRLLGCFLAEHPGIELQLVVGNQKTLLDLIQRSEVDVAIMGRPPAESSTRAEPFAPNPNFLVAPPEHRLAAYDQLSPAMLTDERFVLREHSSHTRAIIDQFLRERSLRPAKVMEIGCNEAIKHAVAANLGIGFLSLHTLKLELQAGLLRILNVEGLPLIRLWHVVHTLNKTLSPAAEALRYYLLENGEKFLEAEFKDVFPDGLAVPSLTKM